VPVGVLGRLGHRRYAGRPRERVDESAHRRPVDVDVGRSGSDQVGEVFDDRVHVGGESAQCRLPFGDGLFQGRPQRGRSGVAQCRGGQRRDPDELVGVEQPAQVGQHPGQLGRPQSVRLVEHHHGDVPVPVELAQVAAVQHQVGVLLRVDHPDDQVDQAE
jgi:hypothetical protein